VFETNSYTVEKQEIIEFAEQFDPQPFHVDEEAAEKSIFGELIASGIHIDGTGQQIDCRRYFPVRSLISAVGEWIICSSVTPSDRERRFGSNSRVLETNTSDRHPDWGIRDVRTARRRRQRRHTAVSSDGRYRPAATGTDRVDPGAVSRWRAV